MSHQFLTRNVLQAMLAAFVSLAILCSAYFVIEPQVSRAVDSGPFSIRQNIGAEISFLVNAANVTMNGTLNGITGGNATGTTQVVVQTNSPSGYYMELDFEDIDSDGVIMRRDLGGTQSAAIRNYATSSGTVVEPDYDFSFASTASMFAYTVAASNTDDIDQSFLNDGVNCNAGSDTTEDVCWMAPSTTAFRVIDRSTSAPQGATSTLRFRVYIPNSPNPGVETGFYTATATLSAYIQ